MSNEHSFVQISQTITIIRVHKKKSTIENNYSKADYDKIDSVYGKIQKLTDKIIFF